MQTDDLRIASIRPLISPAILIEEIPLDEKGIALINSAREQATRIVQGEDDRLLVVVGPCSIHDPEAARAYGSLIKDAVRRYQDDLMIVMRVYFEKPRTTVGWKGLINDPLLDNSFNINQGLRLARQLLRDLTQMGVVTGTEFLDTIIPQFISDLVVWGAIGARTTESQIHRELASGLSMPVGFKNGTDGNIQIAVDAIRSALHPHHFLSVTKHGIPAIVSTTGNEACHLILRGGKQGTNYDAASVEAAVEKLAHERVNLNVMVDCSHGNSRKDHTQQAAVAADVAAQLSAGSQRIMGVMIESNLVAGTQPLKPKSELVYGKSVTDACIAWDETQRVLDQLAAAVRDRRKKKA